MTSKYKATLSRSEGRASWCVIFRHPLRMSNNGKPGHRVRRGLGTSDEHEAHKIVDELNEILADEGLWSPAARELASTKFSPAAVAAFFDKLAPAARDMRELRNGIIPLPTREDGYTRALLLGPTGAGKTTVLRQILGTDPTEERFPSTSASRTTICNTEIIFANGPFKAVVTFQHRDHVRLLVEECVTRAALAKFEGQSDVVASSRLLEHKDMRFRLSYILGTSRPGGDINVDDDGMDDEDSMDSAGESGSALPADEKTANRGKILGYLAEIEAVARESGSAISHAYEDLPKEEQKKVWDSIQELFEENLQDQKDFHDIVDSIVDEVETRFAFVEADGEIVRGDDGWPVTWTAASEDRKEFLKVVNRFTSNYAPQFGRLLTPIVEGIRVCGPFQPAWMADGEHLPLVIYDGEGLGHTTETATSISTGITATFKDVDAIVVVDNAAQPLQAATTAAVRTVTASGHVGKLLLCFTHFEDVKGDNLSDGTDRKNHVLNSVQNAVVSIGESLGRQAENRLRECIEGRAFFLSRIHEPLKETAKGTKKELRALIAEIRSMGMPLSLAEAMPLYDSANLVLGIHRAVNEFHRPWNARLGFASDASIQKEHWATIKALTRRLGVLGEDEYDHLRPVADLIIRLQEEIGRFLLNPLRWDGPSASDSEKADKLEAIKQSVFEMLHDFSKQRVFMQRLSDWAQAYALRGTGSTFIRANEIRSIYESSAPLLGTVPSESSAEFLTGIRRLVKNSIEGSGGRVSGD